MRHPGNLGPRGLDPDDTLELRGNGGGQKQATVETTLKVRDEHAPGDYICVAIQGYDSEGNMVMIKNPKPTRIFRIVNLGNKDDHKMEFLGWGEDVAPVPLHDHPPEHEPDTRRVREVGRSQVTEDVGC